MPKQNLISLLELSRRAKVSPSAALHWANRGKLKRVKAVYKYPEDQVEVLKSLAVRAEKYEEPASQTAQGAV